VIREFNVPLNTLLVISETAFLANQLTALAQLNQTAANYSYQLKNLNYH